METLDEILQLIHETFEVKVSEGTPIDRFCDDDVDVSTLRDSLQVKFGVIIPDEDAEGWESVGDVAATIEELQEAQ